MGTPIVSEGRHRKRALNKLAALLPSLSNDNIDFMVQLATSASKSAADMDADHIRTIVTGETKGWTVITGGKL